MKPTFLIPILLFYFSVTIVAQTKTITNPVYEFKNSGIYNVAKIERTDTATFVSIDVSFVPHWWVSFNETDYIRDCDTGIEYNAKKIMGSEFDQKIWMLDSGDSTIVLVYPPLPASTKKIDFHDLIFGLSISPTQTKNNKQAEISPKIDKWLKEQLAKAPKTAMPNYELSTFFNEKPARLIGYIKGYDPRAAFGTGIVYSQNELINEDFPIVIKIEPDGRFQAEIPMTMPKYTYAAFNNRVTIPFYIEPGQTICMILDWDEFLTFDRRRDIRYQFNQIEFRGSLASINKELMSYPSSQFNYNEYDKKRKTMAPHDFKTDQLANYQQELDKFENYLKNHSLSAKAQTLLRNRIMLQNANNLFNYTLSRDHYARQDSTNKTLRIPIQENYYDFLKQLPLNDPSLLVCNEFSEFINRFEFCELFNKARSKYYQESFKNREKPEKNLLQYFNEEKITLSEDERKFLTIALKNNLTDDDLSKLKQMKELSETFNQKYKDKIQEYADKYVSSIQPDQIQMQMDVWNIKDSILENPLGLQPNLMYEIAKTRSLEFTFNNAESKEKASEYWEFLKQGIKTPYLMTAGDALFKKSFPASAKIVAQPLPNEPGTKVFTKIIAPHKGKVLFVDFWATTCGPCVGSIKNMKKTREKYIDNPDFDFVFITDERSSPERSYTNFVKEQEMKNSYRISNDEFNMLRQLFRFNGIPRYVVIDQKGDVINDNFQMHNFEFELKRIIPSYKN
jgi:thiol-disulfide isomerase/thioredoxin